MIIDPLSYCKFNIEGKSAEEIRIEITKLENEIAFLIDEIKLRNEQKKMVFPYLDTALRMNRKYPKLVKDAVAEL